MPSPFGRRVGLALYLTMTWGWQVSAGPGTKEGSESWTTVGNAHPPTTAWTRPWRAQACSPAQHAFCILQELMAQGLGWEKECAQGESKEAAHSLPREMDSRGGRGCLAALQAQNHKLGRLQGQCVQSLGSGRLR